ncbi:TRAP transporter small permease [Roseomonas sp. CCTCC AB2023176]|uniref:TRAP transporter small permease n=1 Tax=Roseomonas sp. CCTCC AB2023176 TaxID=3342640 RepID=UPI0035DCA52D
MPDVHETRAAPSREDAEQTFAHLAAEEGNQPEPPIEAAPEDWLAFGLFWILSVTVFVQFFTRYVLNSSLSWTEEIAQYMLMVLAFLGSAIAARRGTHIAVEFLFAALPVRARRYARLAAAGVAMAFYGILSFLAWQVSEAMAFQPMVVFPDIPLSYVYWGILFGLVLTTLRSAQAAAQRFAAGEPETPADPSLEARV